MSEFASTQSKREGWPSERAVRLALDLERRGSLEGHYVWSEMIQQALDNAFIEGHQRGLKAQHMDMAEKMRMEVEKDFQKKLHATNQHADAWGLAADAEISRLKELNSSLAYYLKIYVHAHINDQRVPMDIEAWAQKTLKDVK